MLYAQGLCPASALSMDDFSDELNREIAGMLLSGKKPSAIMDALDEDKRGRAAGILQQTAPLSQDTAGQMVADCVEKIRVRKLDEQIDGIKSVGGNAEEKPVLPSDGPVFVHTDDGGHSVLLYTAMGIFASNGQGS